MKIEYKTFYLKIFQGKNYDLVTKAFIPDNITYSGFVTTKEIDNAPGRWVDVNELGDGGWEIIHVMPKHILLIGLFKKTNFTNESILDNISTKDLYDEIPSDKIDIVINELLNESPINTDQSEEPSSSSEPVILKKSLFEETKDIIRWVSSFKEDL